MLGVPKLIFPVSYADQLPCISRSTHATILVGAGCLKINRPYIVYMDAAVNSCLEFPVQTHETKLQWMSGVPKLIYPGQFNTCN